jgi:RNA polymerase sigma-70 factor (ECF subfamily)
MQATPVSILERLRQSEDAAAWQQLVEIYQPWLRGWLRAHLLQTADVDDLVQDVLVVVLRELPNFRHNGRTGAFRTWLRGILLNRLREFRRQRSPSTAPEGDDPERRLANLADDQSELTRQWDREHDENMVKRLLQLIAADFEARTWQAFRAMVMEGRPAASVALELGMSVGAVWSAKSHVFKRLRQEAREMLD